MYLRNGSAINSVRDGSTATCAEAREGAHYARPDQCPLVKERSYKLPTVAVESFGPLGKIIGDKLVDQLPSQLLVCSKGWTATT